MSDRSVAEEEEEEKEVAVFMGDVGRHNFDGREAGPPPDPLRLITVWERRVDEGSSRWVLPPSIRKDPGDARGMFSTRARLAETSNITGEMG